MLLLAAFPSCPFPCYLGATQEMIEKMKSDSASEISRLETELSSTTDERNSLKDELADVVEKLEMRNAQLIEIMAFLQSQQASAEGEGASEGGEDDGGVAGILERTRKGNEALQQQLADYEQENGRLSNDLTKTSRELEKVSTSERKLHDALTALRKEHALLQAELKDKSSLLDRVKGFMQAHQPEKAAAGDDEEAESADASGNPFADFEHKVQQMLLENRKLEQEIARLEHDLAREQKARAALEQTCRYASSTRTHTRMRATHAYHITTHHACTPWLTHTHTHTHTHTQAAEGRDRRPQRKGSRAG
jgi:septal ring factor EnvC (AmiA/AmiB activator)